MAGMTTQISKAARARGQAPEQFAELCKALYGEAIDPQEVWEDVFKASPDQADLHANQGARVRRNVERGSNAIGITAGVLGLSAAAKDPRLAQGGRVSRALYATGKKLPSAVGRIKSRKIQAGLAGAALATQVANLGGDALIAGTLKKPVPPDKVGKSALVLVPTGTVHKALFPKLPKLEKVTQGIRGNWKSIIPTHTQPTLPGMAGQTKSGQRAKAVGADVADALSTKTGKVMAGTLAVGGAGKVNTARRNRRSAVDYAPDYYGKADETVDVEFAGTFSKFDDDKRQVFGWASVVKIDGVPVVDRQGDYIDMGDLEDAAYTYVHKSRVGGDMHKRTADDRAHHVSDMIESMVFTPDKIAKMGLPNDFPQGWWVGYQIHDEPTWDLVKKRGRTGFSIHGKGLRKAQDLDELMGYTQ